MDQNALETLTERLNPVLRTGAGAQPPCYRRALLGGAGRPVVAALLCRAPLCGWQHDALCQCTNWLPACATCPLATAA